jgi:hypothetical protein
MVSPVCQVEKFHNLILAGWLVVVKLLKAAMSKNLKAIF